MKRKRDRVLFLQSSHFNKKFSKNWKKWGLWTIFGALFAALAALVYFSNPFLSIPFIIFGAVKGRELGKKNHEKEEAIRSEEDFARFLEFFAGYLEAGFNPESSLEKTIQTLKKRQSESDKTFPSYFMKNLMNISLHAKEGRNFDQTLILFANNFSGGLVPSFVKHLLLGKKQGADLASLSLNFLYILVDQKELREEREARLYSAKREEIILFIMPFLLLALVRGSGLQEDTGGLLNALVKIFCLFLFALAWKWSQKILKETGLIEYTKSPGEKS